MTPKVQHDEKARKFFTVVDGHEAHLTYAVANETTLDYQHTYVPPELRGRQLAQELVAAAFAYARDKGFKVIPSCTYVQRQAERNEEYGKLTAR